MARRDDTDKLSDILDCSVRQVFETRRELLILSRGVYKGLSWIVRQGPFALCGYVGIPKTHPLFGKDIDEVSDHVDVHGGATWSERQLPWVEEVEETDWWVGFDTGHAEDEGEWSKEKVEEETVRLAEQLSNLSRRLGDGIERAT